MSDPTARRLAEVEQRFLMMCTKHAHSAYCEDVAWLLTERRRLVAALARLQSALEFESSKSLTQDVRGY